MFKNNLLKLKKKMKDANIDLAIITVKINTLVAYTCIQK